jgi:hypothetical protein
MYGMYKTTVYLPDELKHAVEHKARSQGISEAEVIRDAIATATAGYFNPPSPRLGLFDAGEEIASRVDELLAQGFGRG